MRRAGSCWRLAGRCQRSAETSGASSSSTVEDPCPPLTDPPLTKVDPRAACFVVVQVPDWRGPHHPWLRSACQVRHPHRRAGLPQRETVAAPARVRLPVSEKGGEVLDRQLGGSVSRPDQVMLWPVCTRAHRSSLELAGEHNLSSVAFPAISCGVYGYPIRDAAQVAVKACLDFSNQVRQDSNSAWFTYLHLSCVREAPYTFDRLADP